MSLAHKAAINELRERVEKQGKELEELAARIEKIEQRSKPGPKPKE
jgi:hypothetical protein